MTPDRAITLKRAIQCTEARIEFLKHHIADPQTMNAEIQRRIRCIGELQAAINEHEAALDRIAREAANLNESLRIATSKLRSLKREQNAELLKRWIAEYIDIKNQLETVED